MTKQRLLFLGASIHSVAAIKQAAGLGRFVITADYLPKNPGHKFSHSYVNQDVTNQLGMLESARKLKIDGIVTFSEVAAATAAFVAEQLSLPGFSYQAAKIMLNKAKFRSMQHEHGLNAPDFISCAKLQVPLNKSFKEKTKLMFKPIDANSSRGISCIDSSNEKKCIQGFEYAKQYSQLKTVCIEEYIDGTEMGGDGFMINGQLVFSQITQKYKKGFIPEGHSLPATIPFEIQRKIENELTASCNAAGYTNGPLNFDVIINKGAVTVLEMSPRLGGNGISYIIERCTAVNLIKQTLLFALGGKPEFTFNETGKRQCGSWVFGSSHDGMLISIVSKDELMRKVEEVYDFFCWVEPGDVVKKFVHTGNSLGYALFDYSSKSDFHDIVDQIKKALNLNVLPG